MDEVECRFLPIAYFSPNRPDCAPPHRQSQSFICQRGRRCGHAGFAGDIALLLKVGLDHVSTGVTRFRGGRQPKSRTPTVRLISVHQRMQIRRRSSASRPSWSISSRFSARPAKRRHRFFAPSDSAKRARRRNRRKSRYAACPGAGWQSDSAVFRNGAPEFPGRFFAMNNMCQFLGLIESSRSGNPTSRKALQEARPRRPPPTSVKGRTGPAERARRPALGRSQFEGKFPSPAIRGIFPPQSPGRRWISSNEQHIIGWFRVLVRIARGRRPWRSPARRVARKATPISRAGGSCASVRLAKTPAGPNSSHMASASERPRARLGHRTFRFDLTFALGRH